MKCKKEIKSKLIVKKVAITLSVAVFFEYVLFLLETNGKGRTIVVTDRANTFEASWKQVTQHLRKRLFIARVTLNVLKADLGIETVSIPLLLFKNCLIKQM